MKALGFKVSDCFTGDVCGEVWSEDGKMLGQWISSDLNWLKRDLAAHAKDYEYEFVDQIPEFVMNELRRRYEHKT